MKILKFASAALILFISAHSSAELPHVFTSNTPAIASEVNKNFSYLEGLINAGKPGHLTEVDCSDDSNALKDALDNGIYSIRIIGGSCNAGFNIVQKNIEIIGENGSSLAVPLDQKLMVLRSSVELVNLPIYGSLEFRNGSSGYLKDVSINCDSHYYTGSAMPSALLVNASSLVATSSVFGGCGGVAATTGAVIEFEGDNTVTPALGKSALRINDGSVVRASHTLTLNTAANGGTEFKSIWLTNNSTLSLNDSSFNGNVYATSSHLDLRNVSWGSDGSGTIKDMSLHLGTSAHLNDVSLQDGLISMPYNGELFLTSNDQLRHDNVKFELDGVALLLTGTMKGTNMTLRSTRSRVQFWAGDLVDVENQVDVELGDFSHFDLQATVDHTGSLSCSNLASPENCP